MHLKKYLFEINRKLNYLIIIFFFLQMQLGCVSHSETKGIDLEWKLNRGEYLGYKSVYKTFGGDLRLGVPDYSKLEIDSLLQNTKTFSILNRRENALIDIGIVSLSEDSFGVPKGMKKQPEIIRGVINKSGGLESFYLDRFKKNLIALFFQLPNKKIQTGDKWAIDVNFISDAGLLYPVSFDRKNEVKLEKTEMTSEGQIAYLRYNIHEKLQAVYDRKNYSMEASISGTGVFMIEKGRWGQLDLTASINNKGPIVVGEKVIRFAIEQVENVPIEALEFFKKR